MIGSPKVFSRSCPLQDAFPTVSLQGVILNLAVGVVLEMTHEQVSQTELWDWTSLNQHRLVAL